MGVNNFNQLTVWQLGMEIARDIYCKTKTFPRDEMFGLTSQMRRAAVSIASNIAEGFNRQHSRDFQRFLLISLGSCGELQTQLILSSQIGITQPQDNNVLLEKITREQKMLKSFINQLQLKITASSKH
jgi:four helix bundle protein